jgi:hypothetical protein
LVDWAISSGITYSAIVQRIYAGWSIHDALTRPTRITSRSK